MREWHEVVLLRLSKQEARNARGGRLDVLRWDVRGSDVDNVMFRPCREGGKNLVEALDPAPHRSCASVDRCGQFETRAPVGSPSLARRTEDAGT